MYISLKIENLSPGFKTSWDSLRDLIFLIKQIYPGKNFEVDVEFSFANKFFVVLSREILLPKEMVRVDIFPVGGRIDEGMINPQYSSLVTTIVSQIFKFLKESDPANDLLKRAYIPDTDVRISNGLELSVFVNGIRSK